MSGVGDHLKMNTIQSTNDGRHGALKAAWSNVLQAHRNIENSFHGPNADLVALVEQFSKAASAYLIALGALQK
jgi:hypothetical protein